MTEPAAPAAEEEAELEHKQSAAVAAAAKAEQLAEAEQPVNAPAADAVEATVEQDPEEAVQAGPDEPEEPGTHADREAEVEAEPEAGECTNKLFLVVYGTADAALVDVVPWDTAVAVASAVLAAQGQGEGDRGTASYTCGWARATPTRLCHCSSPRTPHSAAASSGT